MDPNKIFGVFPDGFRMAYKDLMDLLLSGESLCGTGTGSGSKAIALPAGMKKLVAEHGGDPKMYWSEGGINV
jgi:hypothetical protein